MDTTPQHNTIEIETGPLCRGGRIAYQYCLDYKCNDPRPLCGQDDCCDMHQGCNRHSRMYIKNQAQKFQQELDDWIWFLEESKKSANILVARLNDLYRLIDALSKDKKNFYPKVPLPKNEIISRIYRQIPKVAELQSKGLQHSQKQIYIFKIVNNLISLMTPPKTWTLQYLLQFIQNKIKYDKDKCFTEQKKRLLNILTKRNHQILTPWQLKLLFDLVCENQPEKDDQISLIRYRVKKSLEVITNSLKSLETTTKDNFQFNLTELKILSKIVREQEQFQLIINQVLPKNLTYKKFDFLFRASQYEFSARKFHQNCDGHPHTLTLIELQNGMKIAAYTSLIWRSQGYYENDPSAQIIIYNLSNQTKFEVKPYYDTQCEGDTGPSFGQAPELQLSDRCDSNQNSFCGLNSRYSNEDFHFNDEEIILKCIGNPYGKSSFTAKEYEVFKVLRELQLHLH